MNFPSVLSHCWRLLSLVFPFDSLEYVPSVVTCTYLHSYTFCPVLILSERWQRYCQLQQFFFCSPSFELWRTTIERMWIFFELGIITPTCFVAYSPKFSLSWNKSCLECLRFMFIIFFVRYNFVEYYNHVVRWNLLSYAVRSGSTGEEFLLTNQNFPDLLLIWYE